MSEYIGGSGSLRVPRQRNASSRRGARDSTYTSTPVIAEDGTFQHTAQNQQYSYQNHLRRASSRISLNDQFAATRSVYDFGFDDAASSVFDRGTVNSRTGLDRGGGDKMSIVDGVDEDGGGSDDDNDDDVFVEESSEDQDGDPYEALILPRNREISTEDIRRAYYRLFLLFYPGSYPEDMRPTAQRQFSLIQAAFEKLVDPDRRARYDLAHLRDSTNSDDRLIFDDGDDAAARCLDLGSSGGSIGSTSHLGIRFDAREASKRRQAHGPTATWPRALDYSLGHSAAIGLPALHRILVSRAAAAAGPGVEVILPSLTVSGAAYGVADRVSSVPVTVMSDAYQPLLPVVVPRRRLLQLVESRLSPMVAARLHTGFVPSPRRPRRTSDVDCPPSSWVRTEVELEATVLPDSGAAARVSHQVVLPALQVRPSAPDVDVDEGEEDRSQLPTTLEVGVSHSLDSSLPRSGMPRLSLGARHALPGGSVFLRADSGDGLPAGDRVCRFLTDFARAGGGMRFAEFPLRSPPSLEAGIQTLPPASSPSTSPRGWWTTAVKASADGVGVGGYVRYSTELPLPPMPQLSTSQKQLSLPQPGQQQRTPSRRRRLLLEAEARADAFQGKHLALRTLLPAGRTSKLGLELGITTSSTHLSIHWSRLGQRFTLPLLVSTHQLLPGASSSSSSSSLAVWTAALAPLLALAAFRLLPSLVLPQRRRRGNRARRRNRGSPDDDRRRADMLTSLLAHPVSARQRHHAGGSSGGGGSEALSIISAKFGVFGDDDDGGGWGGEEVADVTIALAALVSDDGRSLVVPRGLRNACIPGFWDPDPDAEKVLHVRFAWQGREAVVQVKGDEELVLPPAASSCP